MNGTPSYEDVCKFVGRLFLQSQHEYQELVKSYEDLDARFSKAERERDDALRLFKKE